MSCITTISLLKGGDEMYEGVEELFTVVFEDARGAEPHEYDATFCCQTGCVDI